MNVKIAYNFVFLFLLTIFCNSLYAETSDQKNIRILGGDPGGNKKGDLAPYEGYKNLKCPKGFVIGDLLFDQYKEDKKLFTIDYKNVDKYKDRLAPGQYQRVKGNKRFYMNIYPTRRNHKYPKVFYEKTKKNLKTCKVNKRGNLVGFNGGVAFPNPKNGIEAAWNIKNNWLGDSTLGGAMALRYVSPSGRVTKFVNVTKVLTFDNTRLSGILPNPERVRQKLLVKYTYPADTAGMQILIIQYLDDNRNDDTWLYFPALRRVRRASSTDRGGARGGESTLDEQGSAGFRGLISEWNWKLKGKKELYVPMNCSNLFQLGGKDEDECWARDINPKRIRYELRRLWVVEATLKEGVDHDYSKRIEYCDEDSWYFVRGDRYDMRGNLWRTIELYTYTDPCQVWKVTNGIHFINLESGRYELYGGALTKDYREARINVKLDPGEFTVQALKRAGR